MTFGFLKFYYVSQMRKRAENLLEISDKFFGETLAPENFEETLVSEIALAISC
jgi:hypothetical protein